ncbi:adenylyl-sulfate kinase 1, chloroplastic-like isoform X3 [Carex rostrata]
MHTIKPPSRSFGTSIRPSSLLRPSQAVKLKLVSVTQVRARSMEPGMSNGVTSVGKATNIRWHDCQIRKIDRQNLLQQKGCVIWITGLSGSGEVAKLFADAGVICIACLISPYRMERDACRSLLPDSTFVEVFLDCPLEICEARDPKGLYKLARAGKIKGFTGIDDPYEPPLNCEIVIKPKNGDCPSPQTMTEQVASYLQQNGFLHA